MLSLTVKAKFKSLATEGKTSQVPSLPATITDKSGKYLTGTVLEGKDLNIGPTAFVDSGGIIGPTSLSICSQL